MVTDREMLADYARFLRSLVDLSGIRPLKVVVDAGNGMAGLTAPAVLGTAAGQPELPLDVVPLYFELDGTFPNHEANPLEPENLRDLQAAVVEHGADLGLAFDGDADRCFVIDETGRPVSPSAITALVGLREVAREVAAGRAPAVIHNLITSRAVPDLAGRGGRHAGPHPGGPLVHQGRDGRAQRRVRRRAQRPLLLPGLLLRRHRDARRAARARGPGRRPDPGRRPGGAVRRWPRRTSRTWPAARSTRGSPTWPAARARVVRAYVTEQGAGPVEVDELDGLTVTHWDATPRWWFNLRASNTEPLLRLNVEAEDEDIMVKVRDDVLSLVREEAR